MTRCCILGRLSGCAENRPVLRAKILLSVNTRGDLINGDEAYRTELTGRSLQTGNTKQIENSMTRR